MFDYISVKRDERDTGLKEVSLISEREINIG